MTDDDLDVLRERLKDMRRVMPFWRIFPRDTRLKERLGYSRPGKRPVSCDPDEVEIPDVTKTNQTRSLAERAKERWPEKEADYEIKFLAFMEGRDHATYEELKAKVHDDPDASNDAVRQNIHQTNKLIGILENDDSITVFRSRKATVVERSRPDNK